MNEFFIIIQACLRNSTPMSFKPYAVVAGQPRFPDKWTVKMNTGREIVHLQLEYRDLFNEDVFITLCDGEMSVERSIRNISGATVELNELGVEVGGITLGGDSGNDYFYHSENPRIFGRMAIKVDVKRTQDMADSSDFDTVAGNRWADPGVVSDRIGASPYQPFPAILISNYHSPKGLVHGTLSQRVFAHNYLVKHTKGLLQLDIMSTFKAVSHLDFKAGAVLKDSWYMGITNSAADLQKCFDGYTAVLRRKLPPMYGATDINRHSLVWGSWNDGIYRNVTQEKLLKTAAFLVENFPTVQWMQLDDGYALIADDPKGSAHGLGMPYEGEAGLCKDKFPSGLKEFADKVKETGLKPAVWIGGALPDIAPLAKDHPDWFVDYSYRTPDRRVFDISKPEVRDYMCRALDYFLNESGFSGVKQDFWSYVFEDSHALLANKNYSGHQWRDWWLKEIRKRLPADGYLQTGCDIVMANPFLGEYFTNYRYGIDIGSGNWDHVKTNFLWGTACFALHIGDLIVPNSDSVGLFPGLSDTEAMLCINYCLISRSMVEIAGWLYDEPQNHPRFKTLKKTVCCPNNGQNVYFTRYHYRENNEAPAVWYFKGPHFSLMQDNPCLPLRTVALFNIQDSPQDIGFSLAELDLPEEKYFLTDVWDNQAVAVVEKGCSVQMPPHSSRLFSVSRYSDSPQVLDGNIKVNQVFANNKVLSLALAHKGQFEFRFSQKPISAHINGVVVDLNVVPASLGYVAEGSLQAAGIIELEF
jgi:hypothetical protein